CDSIPMPFGGTGTGCDFGTNDPVVDPASPMMVGMPNPIPGSAANHLSFTALPAAAHIVVITDTTGFPALYDFRPGANCGAPTPTPTPSCTPIVVNGVIDASDPTQTDRLFRDGNPSACGAPKVCPGPFGDLLQHHYDSYTFTNTTGASQCVNVDINTACTGTNFIFATAYLGSFDPANLCTNYLADEGASPNPTQPFSFDLADGQTVVIVVAEVTADAGCAGYTMTVTGLCGGGGGGPCTLGPWNVVAPYALVSESVSVSNDGTFAYGVGGFDAVNFVPTNSFNQYDLVNNVWTPLPNITGAFYDAPSVY